MYWYKTIYSSFGKISSVSDEVTNAEDGSSGVSCGAGFPLPVSIASHNCGTPLVTRAVQKIAYIHQPMLLLQLVSRYWSHKNVIMSIKKTSYEPVKCPTHKRIRQPHHTYLVQWCSLDQLKWCWIYLASSKVYWFVKQLFFQLS